MGLMSDQDKEYGSKYQLINVHVGHLTGNNNNQKWKYDAAERKLTTHSHSAKSVFAGSNANVVLFQSRGVKNQIFTYNEGTQSW